MRLSFASRLQLVGHRPFAKIGPGPVRLIAKHDALRSPDGNLAYATSVPGSNPLLNNLE